MHEEPKGHSNPSGLVEPEKHARPFSAAHGEHDELSVAPTVFDHVPSGQGVAHALPAPQ
jgi:hypothetical protein